MGIDAAGIDYGVIILCEGPLADARASTAGTSLGLMRFGTGRSPQIQHAALFDPGESRKKFANFPIRFRLSRTEDRL
jgi:hypothetical protein